MANPIGALEEIRIDDDSSSTMSAHSLDTLGSFPLVHSATSSVSTRRASEPFRGRPMVRGGGEGTDIDPRDAVFHDTFYQPRHSLFAHDSPFFTCASSGDANNNEILSRFPTGWSSDMCSFPSSSGPISSSSHSPPHSLSLHTLSEDGEVPRKHTTTTQREYESSCELESVALDSHAPSVVSVRLERLLQQICDERKWADTVGSCDSSDYCSSEYSYAGMRRYGRTELGMMDNSELLILREQLVAALEGVSERLLGAVKQRNAQLQRRADRCDNVTAVLHARSNKTQLDSLLRFSLDPPRHPSGLREWRHSMRAVCRLSTGMPDQFRAKMWLTLSDSYLSSRGVDWMAVSSRVFSERVLPEDRELSEQIIKDLNRTGWSDFDGSERQAKLRRVLLAYARFNKDIGYCQGFNVIAALILQVVDFKTDAALKVMIFVFESVLPSGYFDNSLRALGVDMAVLKDLLHQRLPRTMQHLKRLQENSGNEYEPALVNVFAMHWFLTLFATCLPIACVFRVWDALVLDGSEVLLRVAVAIWAKLSRKITRCSTADEFYSTMHTLLRDLARMRPMEQNNLIQVVYTMSEFPYPGLSDLREKYTWNIQPLSSSAPLTRRRVDEILQDDTACGGCAAFLDLARCRKTCCCEESEECRRQSDRTLNNELKNLRTEYRQLQKRHKQALLILKSVSIDPSQYPVRPNPPIFNHLEIRGMHQRAASVSGGAVSLRPQCVQPVNNRQMLRERREMEEKEEREEREEREGQTIRGGNMLKEAFRKTSL